MGRNILSLMQAVHQCSTRDEGRYLSKDVYVCAFVHACVCMHVYVCMCVCVHVCVRVQLVFMYLYLCVHS